MRSVRIGYINYDVRSAHLRINNKIKIKFYSFSVNAIIIFIWCNENKQIFTQENTDVLLYLTKISTGIHSKE